MHTPDDKITAFKIFTASQEVADHTLSAGQIKTDNRTFLKVAGNGGFIDVKELQMAGKKKLLISEFLKGFSFDEKSFFQ